MINNASYRRRHFWAAAAFFLLATASLRAQYAHDDSARLFLTEQLNRCHFASFVYFDGNDPCNIFIPFVEGDTTGFTYLTQQDTSLPQSGRSHGLLIYKPSLAAGKGFSGWRYTYGPDNFGNFKGINMKGATRLVFYLKGKGMVEVIVGGTNRAPFHDAAFPFQDGVDARSTGLIALQDTGWTRYELDLTDNRFWIFKSPKAGANNKFPALGSFEDSYDCSQFVSFSLDTMDEKGNELHGFQLDAAKKRLDGFDLLRRLRIPQLEYRPLKAMEFEHLARIRFYNT